MHKKEKNFWGSHKLLQAHKKVCDEKETRKNDERLKYFLMEGQEFIRCVWKTRVMDIKRLQINDPSYIEGTICLVNE